MEAFSNAVPELAALDFRSQMTEESVLALVARKHQSSRALRRGQM